MIPPEQGVADYGADDPKDNKKDPGKKDSDYRIAKFHLPAARWFPLVASILAPLATLLDIPALSERWYIYKGVSVEDPVPCLVLSSVGLLLNLVANALLLIRFTSKTPKYWRPATRLSLLCWLAKLAVALINVSVYGIVHRNAEGYQFSEGFWCAIVSVIVSGIISAALFIHYFFAFGHKDEDSGDVRSNGKRFMLSVTAFIIILGLQSLAFARIEGWSYSDSIYFSVQTALTIGYGDFPPITTAGKVLVFPFSVLTISQLGNEIALIISFISQRSQERRAVWKKRYEGAMHREANAIRPRAGLVEEMALIHQINHREEMLSQMYDLCWSMLSLIVFWIIGATLFSQIEGWPYGDGIYAVMVLSLTIGFGDYTPKQPAGRVVFIVYALMAVPIVTSFAVQTITGLLSTYTYRNDARELFEAERQKDPTTFKPHAAFVSEAHASYKKHRQQLRGAEDDDKGDEAKSDETVVNDAVANESAEGDLHLEGNSEEKSELDHVEQNMRSAHGQNRETEPRSPFSTSSSASSSAIPRTRSPDQMSNHDKGQQNHDLHLDLLKQLMRRTIQLEAEARQLLLDSMETGIARTLLLADRNVQIRDVRALRGDDANMLSIWRGEEDEAVVQESDGDGGLLRRVRRYRNTFAEVLVLGSLLQQLEGEEQNRFERFRKDGEEGDEEEVPDDLKEIAEEKWGGITGMMFRHHAKAIRGGSNDWGRMEAGLEGGHGGEEQSFTKRKKKKKKDGHAHGKEKEKMGEKR